MFSEQGLAMQGRLYIQTFDRRGKLINAIAADNAIVLSGRKLVAQLFLGEKIDYINYLGVGTGGTDVKPDEDNQLGDEIFRKQLNKLDVSKAFTEVKLKDSTGVEQSHSCIRLSTDLDFAEPDPQNNNGEAYSLQEAGLFNSPDIKKGIMYNRVRFPPISKTKDFKLTFVWEIIF